MQVFSGKPIVSSRTVPGAIAAALLLLLSCSGCGPKANVAAMQPAAVPASSAEAPAVPQMVAAPAIQVKVERAVICESVVDRVPQGAADAFYDDVKKLCCFTSVAGALRPMTVEHVWSYKGEEIARVPLKVYSSRWRTHSSVRIRPGQTGEWKVLVTDSTGGTMAETVFEIRGR
ncbi:MAG TPA: DUF2914 domain-containing protein [bacterium]|nr:DUF2914 domain-containing protein [bacterium]